MNQEKCKCKGGICCFGKSSTEKCQCPKVIPQEQEVKEEGKVLLNVNLKTGEEVKEEWESSFDRNFPVKEFRDTGAWYACKQFISQVATQSKEEAKKELNESFGEYSKGLIKDERELIRELIIKEIKIWQNSDSVKLTETDLVLENIIKSINLK